MPTAITLDEEESPYLMNSGSTAQIRSSYLHQKRAQEPVGGPSNPSGRTSVDEMGRISEIDVPRSMRELSNLPILSGFSFSMHGNSFEADISGLIPIPTTNIQPIPPLKSDGKYEITPQPIGMQHTWSCSSCNTAMEHEWWTCSTCGKLKKGWILRSG
jgi:hypothetical protein